MWLLNLGCVWDAMLLFRRFFLFRKIRYLVLSLHLSVLI